MSAGRLTIVLAIVAAAVCSAQEAALIEPGAEIKKLAGGFQFTEGPAADAKGDVYFADIPNNRILKWSVQEGNLSTFLEDSGGANGLYFDNDGNLLACEGGRRRLASITPAGGVAVLAELYEGKKFNSLNDLWIDPKGGVYFTDPRYGNRDGMEQDGEHVYYLTPDHKKVIRVIADMMRPNGVIGTPNGRKLYVADHGAGKTYSYTINRDGTLTDKQLFANQGSDGMTMDNRGNIYLTGKTVTVYSRNGKKLADIEVPEEPANITFGGSNHRTLFITARTSLYSIDMQVRGTRTIVRSDEPAGTRRGEGRRQR